jgi:hypothetical protein
MFLNADLCMPFRNPAGPVQALGPTRPTHPWPSRPAARQALARARRGRPGVPGQAPDPLAAVPAASDDPLAAVLAASDDVLAASDDVLAASDDVLAASDDVRLATRAQDGSRGRQPTPECLVPCSSHGPLQTRAGYPTAYGAAAVRSSAAAVGQPRVG